MHIKYYDEDYWKNMDLASYDGETLLLEPCQGDNGIHYKCIATVEKEQYELDHKNVFQYSIIIDCYVNWDYYTPNKVNLKTYNDVKKYEEANGWSDGRGLVVDSCSVQVELGGETIYDDYYKKQAIDYILQNNPFLEPRKDPYILNDHEGRPWKVTVYQGVKGKDLLLEPLEGVWGIHGNSMPPMNINNNSMPADLSTSEGKASIVWSSFRTIVQVMLDSGGDFLENTYLESIEDAMKAVENNMLKSADSQKARNALKLLNEEMQKILGDHPGGTVAIGEEVLKQAQKRALDTAEAQFKAEMATTQFKAEMATKKVAARSEAAKNGVAKASRGATLKAVGKALDGVNYGMILIDLAVNFAEVTKGNRGDPQACDKGMGAFVDLGVALVSTATAAGAGAAAGAAWGASTGTVIGCVVGVVLGTMWGVANYVCLQKTGVPLSQYLGGKINALLVRHVVPKVQPAVSNVMRDMTTASPEGSYWDIITRMGGGF